MICPIEQSLNNHISEIEAQEDIARAIELLAEKLSCAASSAISNFLRMSVHDFKYKDVNNATNGNDEFNEMFYQVAEKLINSIGG